MHLRQKLALYSPTQKMQAAEKEKNSEEPITEGKTIRFGSRLLKQKEGGFFHYRKEYRQLELGRCRLSDYLPLQLNSIAELALWLPSEQSPAEPFPPEELLFFDIETTGLGRGSGNFAFLVGCASFQSQSLILQQFFLQEPFAEESLLITLQNLFQSHRYLVSYNGRAFDLPLLQNRRIIHRLPAFPERAHLDLLHVVRRLFPHRTLGSYRQGNLERELLQLERKDDLCGEEIPQVYFDYMKYGCDNGMEQIMEHNSLDLQGMVFLLLEIIRLYNRREKSHTMLRSGIARLLLKNGHEQESLNMLAAIEKIERETTEIAKETKRKGEILPDSHQLRYRDLLLLAQLYRRRGDYIKAANIFQQVIESYNCPHARLSLAKLLEHKLRELPAALLQTEQLLKERQGDPLNSLTRRRERILRKMQTKER